MTIEVRKIYALALLFVLFILWQIILKFDFKKSP